jgi:hypothetical protein
VHRTAVREFLKRLSAALLLCSVGIVSAQELAPRAYWPAPVGTNVAVLAYQRSKGDIVIDPSLPITGVESEIDYLQVGYQRYFSLFGRTASQSTFVVRRPWMSPASRRCGKTRKPLLAPASWSRRRPATTMATD